MTYTGQDRVDHFFAHHGIKGQKWGVRRFQNPDGTLTPEGKKRVKKASGAENYYAVRFKDVDKKIQKGQTATRVIRVSNEKKGRKDLYVSAGKNKKDTDMYVNWIGGEDPNDDIKVRSFEFKQDVKVASGKKVWNSIIDELGNTKLSDIKKQKWTGKNESNVFSDYVDWANSSLSKKYKNALDKYLEATTLKEAIEYNNKYGPSKHKSRIFSKNKWADDLASIGLHATRYASLSFTLNKNGLKEKTIEQLKKSGYGALEDINDPDTELPIILFNAPKQVKELETISAKDYKVRRARRGRRNTDHSRNEHYDSV